jgi:hypothetical protein
MAFWSYITDNIILILFSFGQRYEHKRLQRKNKFENSLLKKIPSKFANSQLIR